MIGGGQNVWWWCWLKIKAVGFTAIAIGGSQFLVCSHDGCVIDQGQKTVEFWLAADNDSNVGSNDRGNGRRGWQLGFCNFFSNSFLG